jgi:hypothetical protein
MLDNSLVEDKRNRSCVPNIVIILLCIELIVFISLVVFFDPKGTSSNLFYLFTLGYLLLWNIYFAWHSLVKENGFELSAFMLLTALLNFEGIYFIFTNPVPRNIRFLGLLYFILMYLANLSACYYCYMHFGKQYMKDLESVKDIMILKTIKEYEIFISNVKICFIFTSLIVVTFTFYVVLFWKRFIVFGLIISVFTFGVIVFHAGLGIWSSTKEKRRALISFIAMIPAIQAILLYMVIQISLSPGEKLSRAIYDQSIILLIASLICSLMLFYLARRNLKGFGIGRASIIKQTNDDFIKGMFIQLK